MKWYLGNVKPESVTSATTPRPRYQKPEPGAPFVVDPFEETETSRDSFYSECFKKKSLEPGPHVRCLCDFGVSRQ